MIPIIPYSNLPAIRDVFRAHGVICIVGMFTEPEARTLRIKLEDGYSRHEWLLRWAPKGALSRALLMQRTHGVLMRAVFRRLGELRNFIAGQPESWALDGPQDGWWTDCRLNLYPRGGCYMAEHTDAAYVGAEPPGGFVQPLLQLSQQGEHFHGGGGYVVMGGRRLSVESRIGDVIVYNGTIPHGVLPVDEDHTPVDFETLNGRMVAAVTTLQLRSAA